MKVPARRPHQLYVPFDEAQMTHDRDREGGRIDLFIQGSRDSSFDTRKRRGEVWERAGTAAF